MSRSNGPARKCRHLFTNPEHVHIRTLLKKHNVDDHVHIVYNSGHHAGKPNPKINGNTGKIVRVIKNNVYAVSSKNKEYVISSAHLRAKNDPS